jgi:methylglutaconyl-CoA hydratase
VNNSYRALIIKSETPHFVVHINRPEKRNALNPMVVRELTDVLHRAKENPLVKTFTLSGEGKAFCSGADLEYLMELRAFDFERNRQDSHELAVLYHSLYSFPKPVIAAVNGPAVAGGCGLASVCDIIIASEAALFGYPEVRIGFVAAIVSIFLIRQIGERKAKELLLTGRLIDAEEAESIGLVNKVVSPELLKSEVSRWQNDFLENSPSAMRYTKDIFNTFRYVSVKEILDTFITLNARVRESSDFQDGLTAFLEKRKPQWQ